MSPEVVEIAHGELAISCLQYGKSPTDLIFTHGAGGDLTSEVMVNFSSGFASHSSVLCFKGSMNLKSRVKAFGAVMEDQRGKRVTALGGRSMGARAAVMAATPDTKALVLVSYPLQAEKGEMRDQILLDIHSDVDVLFISGNRDSMCDIEELNDVRRRMKANTWLVIVRDADHGMNVRPKRGVKTVGEVTGQVAAQWLKKRDSRSTECLITFGEDSASPEWGTQCPEFATNETDTGGQTRKEELAATQIAQGKASSRSSQSKKRVHIEIDVSDVRRSSRLRKH